MKHNMNEKQFVVVKNSEGVLRPLAGMWVNDKEGAGIKCAEAFCREGDTVAIVQISEVERTNQ